MALRLRLFSATRPKLVPLPAYRRLLLSLFSRVFSSKCFAQGGGRGVKLFLDMSLWCHFRRRFALHALARPLFLVIGVLVLVREGGQAQFALKLLEGDRRECRAVIDCCDAAFAV